MHFLTSLLKSLVLGVVMVFLATQVTSAQANTDPCQFYDWLKEPGNFYTIVGSKCDPGTYRAELETTAGEAETLTATVQEDGQIVFNFEPLMYAADVGVEIYSENGTTRLIQLVDSITEEDGFLPGRAEPIGRAPDDPRQEEQRLAEESQGTDFRYCEQVPDGPQRRACEDCAKIDPVTQQRTKVFTALGCISVTQEGLAQDLITLLLGISGGVALLSILAAAFLLAISQGDSNKVKQAKELITAAVTGLLFLIFSIFIMEFIGISILRIPGLS